MKFRTIRETVRVPHTVDGETVMVTEDHERHVPVTPRDWDAVATRGVTSAVVLLTLISITWSTASIAQLLGGQWVSYLAASVFDLSWMVALGLSYVARFRPDRRRIADRLSWSLMAVTVAAIFWHGINAHSVPLACVGASVSVAAKLLWWATGRVTEPEISDQDRQWVAAQLSTAAAKMAVAGVRRQVARIEDRAAAELMALEESRRVPGTRDHVETEVPPEVPAVPSWPELTEVSVEAGQMVGPVVSPVAEAENGSSAGTTVTEIPQITAPENGSSAGTKRDLDGGVSETIAPAVRSAGTERHLHPVRGTPTEQIRSLISQGITDTHEIRSALETNGTKVPDPSYIRRLVRQAKSTDVSPGQYL